MTQWSRPCGNMTGGGAGIKPLTKTEALEWCEMYDIPYDIIAEHFEIEEA